MNCRILLQTASALAAVSTGTSAFAQSAGTATEHAVTSPLLFQNDPEFWYETVRLFGAAEYGGALFGEVVAIAQRIEAGNYDSWYDANNAFAERIASEAETQQKKDHRISARDNFLRASSYYRSAEFLLHANPDDPRVKHAYERSVACYKSAAALFTPAIVPLEIPYEGTTLPGYFHSPDTSGRRRPTILLNTGFDGSAEEMHWNGARAAVERGYNVLVFDGPGQFGPLHRQGLHFRPDWEKVVTPVVDFAVARADVDPNKITLYGASFGGYLAPRAAAFEPRLAACIADDGIYDYGASQLAGIPEQARAQVLWALTAPSAPQLDARLEQMMKANSVARWAFTHGMYAMGVNSPRAYLAATQAYNLRDGIAEKIKCPTLVWMPRRIFSSKARRSFSSTTSPVRR